MTREEAIKVLNMVEAYGIADEAKQMAIKALSQEPCDECRYKRTSICGNCKEYDEFEEVDFVQEHKKIPVTLDLTPCGDAISRQAVNTLVDELARAISDERCHIPQRGRDTGHIMHDILDLPSVTPKPTECDDAISRDAVINAFADYYGCKPNDLDAFKEFKFINELPSVRPQKSGKWIETDEGFSPYECSVCGSIEFKGSKYCPNCGAKMESEE